MQEKSYWQSTVEFPKLDVARGLPEQVDVAIVGGGYTGLAAARELAMQGTRVAVFEARTIGWGASSRNGGQVLTGTKLAAGALLKRFGKEMAQRLWRNSLDCIDYIEQLVRSENIACDFGRVGHLELAWKPSHFQAYRHDAALLSREFGHPVSVIEPKDLSSEVGTTRYHGALLDEASAGLNPARYVVGLANAAMRAGAQLYENVPVRQIAIGKGGGYVLAFTKGRVRCKELMIATNGYTGPATPDFQRKIVPIGSYMIATEPLPTDVAKSLIPKRRMIFDSKNFLYYWRLSADNRMVFGGRASFVPETPNTIRESAEILHRSMIEVHPQLREAKVDYAWGGSLGFTFDLLPHAGQNGQGIYYALGCGGHGVAMLSHLGASVARRILGDVDDNPIFSLPMPSAPMNLYNGNPWFLPLVGLYYRAKDWIS